MCRVLKNRPKWAMAWPNAVGCPSREIILVTSCADTSPEWIDTAIRHMSSQCAAILAVSITPRAALSSGP